MVRGLLPEAKSHRSPLLLHLGRLCLAIFTAYFVGQACGPPPPNPGDERIPEMVYPPDGAEIRIPRVLVSVNVLEVAGADDFDVQLTVGTDPPLSIRSSFVFASGGTNGREIWEAGIEVLVGSHALEVTQLDSGGPPVAAEDGPTDFTVIAGPTTLVETLGDSLGTISGQMGQGAVLRDSGESWLLFSETGLGSTTLTAAQADTSPGDAENGITLEFFDEESGIGNVQPVLNLVAPCGGCPDEEELWLSGPFERFDTASVIGGWNVYSYYTRVDNDAPPKERGVGLAVGYGGGQRPLLRLAFAQDAYFQDNFSLFSPDEFRSVRGVVHDGSDIVLFGTILGSVTNDVVLARVPLDSAQDRSAYLFWTDDGTGPDWRPSTIGRLAVWDNSSAPTVHWNDHLQRWLAVSAHHFSEPAPYSGLLKLESDIVLRTAAELEGPWGPPVVAWEFPAPVSDSSVATARNPTQLVGYDTGSLIYVMATDDSDDPPGSAGPLAPRLYEIDLDEILPAVAITSPVEGALLSSRPVTVTGTVERATSLTVNGAPATITAGMFSASVFIDEGDSTIAVIATNDLGTTEVAVNITLDVSKPIVTISVPEDGATFTATPVLVTGTVVDASAITSLFVDGTMVAAGNTFSKLVDLTPGSSKLVRVTATDEAGYSGFDEISINLATPGALALSVDGDGSATNAASTTVTGIVSHDTASITANGVLATVTGANWSTPLVPLNTVGPNEITVIATLVPEVVQVTINILRTSASVPMPPEAPTPGPIDSSIIEPMLSQVEFLYTPGDPNQVQIDVTATIEERRVAVIRGRALTKGGSPLPSVKVSIKDHIEYGSTLTRADGEFDLVVNGGMEYILVYERAEFFKAFRRVAVPWREFALAPDVRLLTEDPASTVILQNQSAFQVATGSSVSDIEGTRQSKLFFPPNTTATAVGGTSGLGTSPFTVRITDAQVGETGTSAIPADLAPGTVAGYIAEFSIDEAEDAGASEVTFDNPVLLYVDNYLGLDVGAPFPMAWLDEDAAAFSPEAEGRVLAMVDEQLGEALIDLDGDGNAETNAVLDAAGIGMLERQALSAEYDASPGSHKELWRVPIAHFSCGGHGAPVFASGSLFPSMGSPSGEEPDCGTCSGSTIRLGSQSLGESVRIVGTPFSLHYESGRTPGKRTAYTLNIPTTPDMLPGPLLDAEVEVHAGGIRSLPSLARDPQTQLPDPSQEVQFIWDGIDAYGRTLQGRQPVRVFIRYAYPLSFGGGREGVGFLTQPWQGFIGPWDARGIGLGGWTISEHHFYDPNGKILYRGDGTTLRAEDLPFVTSKVATGTTQLGPVVVAAGADGTIYTHGSFPSVGDSIYATDADGTVTTVLSNVAAPISSIAVAPDRSLYLSFRSPQDTVEKITVDAAGMPTCTPTVNCENVITGGFTVLGVQNLALGDDGALYVADTAMQRVLKVDPTGETTVIAGGGTTTLPAAFGGLAVDANLSPSVQGVAVGRDGSVYASIPGDTDRIVRILPNGVLREFAGAFGSQSENFDGIDALDLILEQPGSLAVGSDASVFVSDGGNANRIWRISPDGKAQTILGTGLTQPNDLGNAGPATNIWVPGQITFDPEGRFYAVATGPGHNRTIRLGSALPGYSPSVVGEILVPSKDGTEVYKFAPDGRHLETKEPLTDSIIRSFTYESNLLQEIHDAEGDVELRVLRDSGGHPLGVEAFEQTTSFSLDPNGYLGTISDPSGATYTMGYKENGLLESFEDPNSNASTFMYDNMGRLHKDTDAKLAIQTIDVIEQTAQYEEVTLTTEEGRVTHFSIDKLSSGDEVHTLTNPAGFQTILTLSESGSKTLWMPGLLEGDPTMPGEPPLPGVTLQEIGDVRFAFGMSAPLPGRLTIDTPASPGPFFERLQTREETETEVTDTITVNGAGATVEYNKSSHEVTTTTFASRILTDSLDPNSGRLTKTEVNGIAAISLDYYPDGRLHKLKQGDGFDERVVTFTYNSDGTLDTVTDPMQRTADFEYDLAGRVTSQEVSSGGVPVQTTNFDYDLKGNLKSLEPDGRPLHEFDPYTAVDLQEFYKPPDVPEQDDPDTTFVYNLDRQLTEVINPDDSLNGDKTVEIIYESPLPPELPTDRVERVKTSTVVIDVDYFSTSGNVETLTTSDPAVGTVWETLTFAYDGFLPLSTTWSGTVSGVVSHEYDDSFRVELEQIDGDPLLDASFEYDGDGLLTLAGSEILVRDSTTGLLDTTELDDIYTDANYNAFGELKDFSAEFGVTNPVALYDLTLDDGTTPGKRDKLGRIQRKVESISGGTDSITSYEYDPAGRLWRVWDGEAGVGSLTQEFDYDANGSREDPVDPDRHDYDNQDRLTSYDNDRILFGYNLAGDLTSRTEAGTTTSYVYDALGNLLSVTFDSGRRIEYVHDGQNRRIAKKVCAAPCSAGTQAVFERGWLYGDQLNPVAEVERTDPAIPATQFVSARFVYGSHSNVPDYMIKGGTTYRILSDNLSSPRVIVDSNTGTIVQEVEYSAFGERAVVSVAMGFDEVHLFSFAGGLYDPETKLVRFGVRDYDPEIGRWVSKDPWLFNASDSNVYAYTLNDPVNFIDPDGTVFFIPGAVVGGVVGGVTAYTAPGSTVGTVVVGALVGAAVGGFAPWLSQGLGRLATAGVRAAASGVQSAVSQGVGNVVSGQGSLGCVDGRAVLGAAVGGAAFGGLGNRFGAAVARGVPGLGQSARGVLGSVLGGFSGALGGAAAGQAQGAARRHWQSGGHPLGRII